MVRFVIGLLFLYVLTVVSVIAENVNDCGSTPPKLTLKALPGRGWCNLRNKEMDQVLQLTYKNCKFTPDGLLQIPDNMDVIPVQESDVQLFSDLYDSWSNYTSTTSKSINMNVDVGIGSFGISGSFSDDHQHCKTNQVNLKTVTTRVQARYTLYTVVTSVSAEINPELKSSLQKVIDAMKSENDEAVDYLLEIIVREYGTHLITRVDAGALIFQEDYISRDYRAQLSSESQVIKAAASARFTSHFNFGTQYSTSVNSTTASTYEKSLQASHVNSYGGMLLLPGNLSIDTWVNSIPSNLVPIDREGDPLYFIITPSAFSNESLETIDGLRLRLQNTINKYYKYNKHVGCMKLGSKNFDFNSNIDNGMCEEPANNFTFGGVFQTCAYDSAESLKECNRFLHKNVLTQDYSCPVGYSPVLLMTSKENFCYDCSFKSWFWWHRRTCCSDVTVQSFWCAALTNVSANTGVMFGGLFTSKMDNPTTQKQSCPPTYIEATLFENLKICIGNDYELGSRFRTDFGGFFSCQASNPLYDRTDLKLFKLRSNRNLSNNTITEVAKTCPGGYTQHTALIYKDCQISYCVKAGSFAAFGELPILLPPFQNYTGIFDHDHEKKYADTPSSTGLLVAVIVLSVILSVTVFGIAFKVWRNKRNPNVVAEIQQNLLENEITGETNEINETA